MNVIFEQYYVCHLKNGITLDFNKKCELIAPLNNTDKLLKFMAYGSKCLAVIPIENILYVDLIEK